MQLVITQPDDWHLHLRDGNALNTTAPFTAKQFSRAIIMPNLQVPVTTVKKAQDYRQRILSSLPEKNNFVPLMTLYLTDNTTSNEIIEAKNNNITAIKYYPAGSTTNSDNGVTDINKCTQALAAMEKNKIPLLVHGESTNTTCDIFDREKEFIDLTLAQLVKNFPGLKIVFEHITTSEAVDYVLAANENLGATITPQHLLLNRNAIFENGIRPYNYCLPVLKREKHRLKLIAAATSKNRKFFLGTDSAPHTRKNKESSCGCAGIFSAHAAIEIYTMIFDKEKKLDALESFASFHGADFYGLPRNTDKITLEKKCWTVPEHYPYENDVIVPFLAGEEVTWTLMNK